MASDKLANAVGGKTARACDSCIRKRARWFCPADDAFLCQSCDASVHSANPLARRHERVRLKTASSRSHLENFLPSWKNLGFTRKARTPRNKKQSYHGVSASSEGSMQNPLPFVPEMGTEEDNPHEENEEQLLYRVPVFDPFAAQVCMNNPGTSSSGASMMAVDDDDVQFKGFSQEGMMISSLHGFLPSDMDAADFAADVESLLGKGLDEESFDMEGLGLLDCKENGIFLETGKVKIEDEKEEEEEEEEDDDQVVDHIDIDMNRVSFEFDFDFESPEPCEVEEDKKDIGVIEECKLREDEEEKKKKKALLRLDYEGVIAAWANHKSPWTTGHRPELGPNDCWPDFMGICGGVDHMQYGDIGMVGGHSSLMGDGGREARVSRYREKRRTRLFSKKIRYEVRKLNAEKRPRMKGRFVKRANFAGNGSSFAL